MDKLLSSKKNKQTLGKNMKYIKMALLGFIIFLFNSGCVVYKLHTLKQSKPKYAKVLHSFSCQDTGDYTFYFEKGMKFPLLDVSNYKMAPFNLPNNKLPSQSIAILIHESVLSNGETLKYFAVVNFKGAFFFKNAYIARSVGPYKAIFQGHCTTNNTVNFKIVDCIKY